MQKGEQKMLKTLGAVYIYIYIEILNNKENINEDEINKAMCFRRI